MPASQSPRLDTMPALSPLVRELSLLRSSDGYGSHLQGAIVRGYQLRWRTTVTSTYTVTSHADMERGFVRSVIRCGKKPPTLVRKSDASTAAEMDVRQSITCRSDFYLLEILRHTHPAVDHRAIWTTRGKGLAPLSSLICIPSSTWQNRVAQRRLPVKHQPCHPPASGTFCSTWVNIIESNTGLQPGWLTRTS